MSKVNYPYYEHTPVFTPKELLAFCADKHGTKPEFVEVFNVS